LKTNATTAVDRKFIILLLALLLAVSNVAYSAHVSKHNLSDTGFCSLCIHPGSPNAAIVNQSSPFLIEAPSLALNRIEPAIRYLRVVRCANQSRAPPQFA
jgi:hypothetical protein